MNLHVPAIPVEDGEAILEEHFPPLGTNSSYTNY